MGDRRLYCLHFPFRELSVLSVPGTVFRFVRPYNAVVRASACLIVVVGVTLFFFISDEVASNGDTFSTCDYVSLRLVPDGVCLFLFYETDYGRYGGYGYSCVV